MIFEVERVDESENIIYGFLSENGRDLTDIAHAFMESPPPGVACSEQLCPVESRNDPDGSWHVAFRAKQSGIAAEIAAGRAQIHPRVIAPGNKLVFDIIQGDRIQKGAVTEPGVCDYCKAKIRAGDLPPYHRNCRCKNVEKNHSKVCEVKKMSTQLDKLHSELEQISKNFIRKSCANPTKADKAVAIAKASRTPEGAKLARQIINLERQEAASLAYPGL